MRSITYFNYKLIQWEALVQLKNFETCGHTITTIWHYAREITITLMTLYLIFKIFQIFLRIALSVNLLSYGKTPTYALQPLNPIPEINFYNYVKQDFRKQMSVKLHSTHVNNQMILGQQGCPVK